MLLESIWHLIIRSDAIFVKCCYFFSRISTGLNTFNSSFERFSVYRPQFVALSIFFSANLVKYKMDNSQNEFEFLHNWFTFKVLKKHVGYLFFFFTFLTAILHRGLRNDFFFFSQFTFSFSIWTSISHFSLDFYFPFWLLFPFFLWTFIQSWSHFGFLSIFLYLRSFTFYVLVWHYPLLYLRIFLSTIFFQF